MKRIRHGRLGMDRLGRASPGMAPQATRGSTRRDVSGQGWALHCRHGEAGIGPARRGMVRLAKLGVAAHPGAGFPAPNPFSDLIQ